MTREEAERIREAHYIDHAPATGPRSMTIPFERCEASVCEEAREVLAKSTPPERTAA
jgi:hypothetical protein